MGGFFLRDDLASESFSSDMLVYIFSATGILAWCDCSGLVGANLFARRLHDHRRVDKQALAVAIPDRSFSSKRKEPS